MAPAAFAGASPPARRGGRRGRTREDIIDAIREWVAAYGEPPRAADWNPSSAKWSGQQWRVARYRAGRADGSAWPGLNAAKRPFGGSLTAAIIAAGYAPATPGPKRRAGVDVAQAGRPVMSPEGRAMLEAAVAQAREAERRVAAVERRLERAEAKIATLRDQSRGRGAGASPAQEAAVRGGQALTAAQLAELRQAGPAGPAVLAEALRALARARAAGSAVQLRAALRAVAEAAVSWQERI